MSESVPPPGDADVPSRPPPGTTSPTPFRGLSRRATCRRCALWIVIGCVLGSPSFLIALGETDVSPTAMILGIVMYGGAIGLVSSSAGFRRRLESPFVARSLKFGYGIRLLAGAIPHVTISLDLLTGIFALMAGELLEQSAGFNSFFATLASTLVQGTLINAAVLIVVSFAWLLQTMFMEWKPPVQDPRACAGCGYHLETLAPETTTTCPECGRVNQGLNERPPWLDRVSWPWFLGVMIPAGVGGVLVQCLAFFLLGM